VSASALDRFLDHAAGGAFALLDGNDATGAPGVWLLRSVQTRIVVTQATDIEDACARIETAARDAHVVVLIDYELGYWLEPAAAGNAKPNIAEPPLHAWSFAESLWLPRAEFDAQLAQRVARLPEGRRHAGIANLRYGLSEASYLAAIERILDYIRDGDVYQINFTWPMHFRSYGAPLALYAALRRRQPVAYGAFVHAKDRCVLSLSPELFLDKRGTRLTSKPMKGTAPRGTTPAEDRRLAIALQESAKDRAENVMIVDLIRNDMGRLARPGSVAVDALFAIEGYPTVHQMVSTVSAEIDAPLYDVLRALFPCGSITGAPKIRAMQIALELESGPRGLYTGSIGHFLPGGDYSFNVAIRTVELKAEESNGERQGRLSIGGGIVADSQPAREFRECLDKARFLTALPAAFRLIETLRVEPGAAQPYPLLARHLQRLRRSAAYFSFALDESAVREALLWSAAKLPGPEKHRVRLTLGQGGDIEIDTLALDPLPDLPSVVIAEATVDSRNLLLRHKTTLRSTYDRELADAREQGHFDALFFNEKGELTEGARTTVYLVRGGHWRTPALDCGVLEGVMRQEVLETRRPAVIEARLSREDLLSADEIWLSNALRGLFRAQLKDG
jgi:para-aminobenzoate synthetase / 4-amino-4-deoxychorismate lyase